MEFSNASVDPSQLPNASGVPFTPLEKPYARSLSWQWLLSALLFIAVAAGLYIGVKKIRSDLYLIISFSVISLTHFIGWYLAMLSFRRKAYALRERDILYRSGWLVQSVSVCPFSRVQHCSVSSGLIDRKFGLATLRVYTAGSDGDIAIPGLKEADAFSMKAYITGKINADEPANV